MSAGMSEAKPKDLLIHPSGMGHSRTQVTRLNDSRVRAATL